MALDEERSSHRERPDELGTDRGQDLSRLLALSDGVFAFAMTLLVINLIVPTSAALDSLAPGQGTNAQLARYLTGEETAFFAYGLAFFIIGTWWTAHQRIFRVLREYDRRLVMTNLVFLLFIAITPFEVGMLANFGDTSVAVVFYAATQALVGAMLLTLWLYVRGPGRPLVSSHVPPAVLDRGARGALLAPAGFALSIPAAIVAPYAGIGVWFVVLAVRFAVLRRGEPSRRPAARP